MMLDETRTALVAAAQADARQFCDQAFETLAKGDKRWVKGKPVTEPVGPVRTKLLRCLQLEAFERSRRVERRVCAVVETSMPYQPMLDDGTSYALINEAIGVYKAAGIAAVEEMWPVAR